MSKILLIAALLAQTIFIAGCEKSGQEEAAAAAVGSADRPIDVAGGAASVASGEFRTLEWTDLMPQDDLDALLNPPEYIEDIEDGSKEDTIASELQSASPVAETDRYQQALVSKRIVEEMDGQAIRLPGFIVPLEFDDEQVITQFFLVPFFGACLHMPPPPPNQIIFVESETGIKLESLAEPFWISGIVKTSVVENEVASAAYSMEMQFFEEYTY